MKNIIIMCRPEGTSRVFNVNQLDKESAQISLANDVNAAAKLISAKGYAPVVCNLFAWKYEAMSMRYVNYLADNVIVASGTEIGRYLTDCEGAVLVGMTAKAGTERAFCAGTYNHVAWHDYAINGRSMGETGIYHTFFSRFGIPVLAVTGDEACCAEVKDTLKDAVAIPVKKAKYRDLAELYDEKITSKAIHEGISAALCKAGRPENQTIELPLYVKVIYNRTDFCDDSYARNNGWLKRYDARTLEKKVEKIERISDLVF